jgi:sugar lactone lactonase YvrE
MKNFILLLFVAFGSVTQLNAHPAWGIQVDKNENIYFADISHNGRGTIWKLTNQGELIALLKDFHSHNVSLDKDGNLYASHSEGIQRLVKILPDGKTFETLITERGETKFWGGNTTVSKNGNVYFGIRKHIWKYNKDSSPLKFNPHQLEWNQTVFVDENENIYVPDIGVGNGTVFKLTSDGKVEKIAEDLISKLDRPKDKHNDVLLGIAKDGDGFLYIAELAGRRIIKILKNGKAETFYKSEENWLPTAITFIEDEQYILEFGTDREHIGPRIIKINKSGKKTELLNYGKYKKTVANKLSVDNNSLKADGWSWFYSLKHVGQNLALLVQEFIMISFLPWRPFLPLRETSFGLRIYLPPRGKGA